MCGWWYGENVPSSTATVLLGVQLWQMKGWCKKMLSWVIDAGLLFPRLQWSICRSGAGHPPHSTCQTPRLQLTEGCWTPSAVAFQNTDPDPLWPCWSANTPAYLLYDKRHLWSRCCLQHVFNIQAADCVIAARHPGGKSRHQLCVNTPLWRWFEIQQRLRKRGVQTWQLHPRSPETKAFLKIQQALDVVGSGFQIELTCSVSILCF